MAYKMKNVKFEIRAASEKFRGYLEKAKEKLALAFSENGISESESAETTIIFCETKIGEAGKHGFRAVKDDISLKIEIAHPNKIDKALDELIAKIRSSGLDFAEFVPTVDTSCVHYDDFGAVGDGMTNDFYAMKRAHEFANEGGQTVMARKEKTYLITEADEPISIRTDVDFGGAKLIFDDRYVTQIDNKTDIPGIIYDSILFRVDNDYPYIRQDSDMIAKLNSAKDEEGFVLRGMESGKTTEKINLKLGYPAMLLLKDAKHPSYKRYGFINGYKGRELSEVIVVDAEGNIDPETPMLHDFREISNVIVCRIDNRPISIKNAVIETRASQINTPITYCIKRNFSIERPHVTFENIEHYVTGEIPRFAPVRQDETGLSYSVESEGFKGDGGKIFDKDGNEYTGSDIKPFFGPAYYGFIYINVTHDVLVKNCSFQSRVLYADGTYDITAGMANKIVFEDCTQSNFFEKDKDGNETKMPNMRLCWGVAGTNYCKNLDFIRCRLTRYDAHAGVTNGKIIDSEITVLCLIGGGNFLISGTKIYTRYNHPIRFRDDYGASFNGTLTIKDCEVIDTWETGRTVTSFISALNSYWDMGYKTFFPNIIVDNLKIDKTIYPEIALVQSGKRKYMPSHYPTANIIKDRREDPETPFDLYIETTEPDKFIAENIESADGEFRGLEYKSVKNDNGATTVIIKDTKNRYPYTPPKFIEVKNNENNGYQLTLFESSFFENTKIIADGNNLKITNAPDYDV